MDPEATLDAEVVAFLRRTHAEHEREPRMRTRPRLHRAAVKEFPELTEDMISAALTASGLFSDEPDPHPRTALVTERSGWKLLARWLEERENDENGRTSAQSLESWLEANEDSQVREAAIALGALPGQPAWRRLQLGSVEGSEVKEALVNRALEHPATEWLIGTFITGDPATRRLVHQPLKDLDQQRLWTALNTLLTELPDGDLLLRITAKGVQGLTKLLPTPIPDNVRQTALDTVDRVVSTATHEGSISLLDLATSQVGPADLSRLLDARSPSSVTALTQLLQDESAEPDGLRGRMLRSLALTRHRQVVERPATWSGINADQLGGLSRDEALAALLFGPLETTVTGPAVRLFTSRCRVHEIFRLVGDHPRLSRYVPVDRLIELSASSEASSKLLAAFRQRVLELAREDLAAERADLLGTLEQAQQELAEEREAMAERHASIEANVAQREREIRSSVRGAQQAHDAELRQARLDVLRSLTQTADEMRSLASLDSPLQQSLLGLLAEVEQRLRAFGIAVAGQIGDIVPFDPSVHQGYEGERGDPVRLLTPAYILADGTDTPLVHARVVAKR